jgi:hypothetical protein
MSDIRKMSRVRIDQVLIEQIDYYDLFPKGMWSRQARVNYLVRVGLGVLLEIFESECQERQKNPKPVDKFTEINKQLSVESALRRVNEMKVPKSEVARLLNRSCYG